MFAAMQSTGTFVRSYLKKLPIGLILLVALIAGALVLFSYVAHEVFWEKEYEIDDEVLNGLSSHVSKGLTGFMETVTHFASARYLQIAYGVLIVIFLIKNFKRAIEIAAIGMGGFLLNYFMKLSFQRIRPPNPLIEPLQNFSFPSGHATSGFIFYGLLAYLIWKSDIPKLWKYIAGIILISFSLLIGFSRIYLRLHYPSDVVAGFCIGFAWLVLTILLFEKLKKKTDEEQTKKNKDRKKS